MREAEAHDLDVETTFPRLVAGRSLADAADVAAVLRSRVDRWAEAAGGRRRTAGNLIAGLIPRVQGVRDPEMAQALAERDDACKSVPARGGGKASQWVTVGATALGSLSRVRSFPTGPLGK